MPGNLLATSNSEARTTSGFRALLTRGWDTARDTLQDLVFPPSCLHCGRLDDRWCPTCSQLLAAVPLDLIQREFLGEVNGWVAATGLHSDILRDAVHALKYSYDDRMARPLAKRLKIALDGLMWQPEIVIPVPLHQTRLHERGYNQAGLLAKYLAAAHELSYLPHLLQRTRITRSQVGLNPSERRLNVQGAFTCVPNPKRPQAVHGHIILLVDDVYTTGATLSACAAALQAAGAKKVYGLTVTSAFK